MIKSQKLKNRRIGLGITGSIGAIQCVKLIRELIRHGADVIPIMTKESLKMVTPEAIEFASGKKPIIDITGDVEHVKFCGGKWEAIDLLLISPATANTISKILYGIGDTTVSLFALTAIGNKIPIMIMPAMHSTMYDHPAIKNNIIELRRMGVEIIQPQLGEEKAKIANLDLAVKYTIRRLGQRDMLGKEVLIIAGATGEHIDEVRMITNRSSGKTGIALAMNAFERGANVEMWFGNGIYEPPYFIKTRRFETVDDLLGLVNYSKIYPFDIIINCAAISDYTIDKYNGKIDSGRDQLTLQLQPTQKVNPHIRKRAPDSFLTAFKLECCISDEDLIHRARNRMEEMELDLMVANKFEDVKPDEAKIFILDRDNNSTITQGSKDDNASVIFDEILKRNKSGPIN